MDALYTFITLTNSKKGYKYKVDETIKQNTGGIDLFSGLSDVDKTMVFYDLNIPNGEIAAISSVVYKVDVKFLESDKKTIGNRILDMLSKKARIKKEYILAPDTLYSQNFEFNIGGIHTYVDAKTLYIMIIQAEKENQPMFDNDAWKKMFAIYKNPRDKKEEPILLFKYTAYPIVLQLFKEVLKPEQWEDKIDIRRAPPTLDTQLVKEVLLARDFFSKNPKFTWLTYGTIIQKPKDRSVSKEIIKNYNGTISRGRETTRSNQDTMKSEKPKMQQEYPTNITTYKDEKSQVKDLEKKLNEKIDTQMDKMQKMFEMMMDKMSQANTTPRFNKPVTIKQEEEPSFRAGDDDGDWPA